MIDIFANVIQIIVFASCTDALLSVGSSNQTAHVTLRINSTLEDWLKLHSSENNTFLLLDL